MMTSTVCIWYTSRKIFPTTPKHYWNVNLVIMPKLITFLTTPLLWYVGKTKFIFFRIDFHSFSIGKGFGTQSRFDFVG